MRYADQMRTNKATQLGVAVCLAAVASACLIGCGQRPLSLYEGLQSGQHDVVARSAVKAGQQRDVGAVPYLIDRLEHESPAVRVAAIGSLRRITGRDFGYSPLSDPSHRRKAVRQWRQWLTDARPVETGG